MAADRLISFIVATFLYNYAIYLARVTAKFIHSTLLCLKMKVNVFENHRKVIFNIASEASYVYILSRQKFIKNAKSFVEFLKS